MTTFSLLLFLHVCAVIVWVGGMAIMHFAVRPAAVAMLEPAQRVPFMAAALGRFFTLVTIAIVVLLLTGIGMIHFMASVGRLPASVTVMAALGILMMIIFGHIRLAIYPRLRRAVDAKIWADGARALASIRTLVAVNLVLGTLTAGIAILGRTLLV